MHGAGHPKPELWDNLGGWGGEGGGTGFRRRGHRYTRGRVISMYGKNHHDIVK